MTHAHDDPPSFQLPEPQLVDTIRAGIEALKRRNARTDHPRGDHDGSDHEADPRDPRPARRAP